VYRSGARTGASLAKPAKSGGSGFFKDKLFE